MITTTQVPKTIMKVKYLFLLAGIGFLFFLQGCQAQKEHEEKHDKYFVTSPVIRDTFTTREYVCQIKAIQHIELRALDRGYLQEIFVDEGKFVPKGTLMFRLLPIQYQAELRKAQAEADYAKIDYQQAKILADSNVISPIQLALVKAKFDKANAELSYAQVRMSFTEIRAPFSGLMDHFMVRQGSLLDEGDLLTTMSDISQLWVYFNVPEAEYIEYKQNHRDNTPMKVQLRMANHELYNQIGEVKTIEADFNNQTGNIAFRATFPNPEGLLRHGETGNIIVTLPLKKAMIIPQKATFEVLDQKYVYVIDHNNVVKSRRISVLAELPDLYVISEGLHPNDKILLEGLRKVRENDVIEYAFQQPNEVIANLKLHAE
jgi:membrane fusion protein (multidrug efflux system)